MSAEITELQQRIANLIRAGRVHSMDLTNARLRIAFGKDDSNVSGWVPWMTARAGATREWNPPAVGEQVVLMNPSGQDNAGFAMPGGIYKNDYPANGGDAGHVELDLPETGAWIIRIGDVVIHAADGSAKITVGGSSLEVTPSKLIIVGDIEVTGGITTTDDVVAGSISLQTHVHGGVEPGGSTTSTPV